MGEDVYFFRYSGKTLVRKLIDKVYHQHRIPSSISAFPMKHYSLHPAGAYSKKE